MFLLKDTYKFLVWWFLKIPKKIIAVFKRILIIVNNQFSFFLNIKMFFVPLFGDYSWVGRVMGFVYRLIKIVFGIALLFTVFVLGIIVVLVWYFIPPLLFYYVDFMALPIIIMTFLIWKILVRDLPDNRVNKISGDNMLESFRPSAKKYLDSFTLDKAETLERFFINKDINLVLKRFELLNTDFTETIVNNLQEINFKKVIGKSFEYAKKSGDKYVELEYLFLGIISNYNDYEKFLSKYNLTLKLCEEGVFWIMKKRQRLSSVYFWQEDFKVPLMGGVNRAKTGRVTPILDQVSVDLTQRAQKGLLGEITAHEEETKDIINILSSTGNKNVLIMGPPGCGKTSVVKKIAQEIVKGTREKSLKFKRVVSVDAGSLISGANSAGEVSERIKRSLDDAQGSGDIILFFDEIHNLVLAGGQVNTAIFSLLEPYLSTGNFQVIGATNLENYRKYIEPNGSFARLFKIVEIDETTVEETKEILEHVAWDFERKEGVFISYLALHQTVTLSKDLIHERVFPDKAILVLSRAITEKIDNKYVVSDDISGTISKMTHVPVTALKKDESQKLLNIEKEMKKAIIGQDHAIAVIGKAMKRGRTGLRGEERPIASFLFVGTTGVGKTETAKVLANYYFGSRKMMIRLDMSEYQSPGSIDKLIGSSNTATSGVLIDAVRKSPFSLILLDEIEKADARVITAFLQVLDDGRLTDPSGKVADFTNTIIIATSNVGTRKIQEISEKGGDFEQIKKAAASEVRNYFAPEFLNRFSDIVIYKPLSTDSVIRIAKIMLDGVRQKVKEKGIRVSFKPALIEKLVERGYSKQWGARPLRREIEDSVETYLAVRLLSGDLNKGDEVELGLEVFD